LGVFLSSYQQFPLKNAQGATKLIPIQGKEEGSLSAIKGTD
jgi:hypothetical protein